MAGSIYRSLSLLLLLLFVASCTPEEIASPTPLPAYTPIPSPTPAPSPTPSPTPIPTATPRPRPTVLPATPTPLPPTPTPGPTPTPTPPPTLNRAQLLAEVAPSVALIESDLGQGSGFVFDSAGLVMTSARLVRGVDTVGVTLSTAGFFQGVVISRDEFTDIALVRVQPLDPLPALEFVAPENIGPGLQVAALGYPEESLVGPIVSLTAGVLTTVRTVGSTRYVQTDAPLNSGNRGGPLVNYQGRVVGMNSTALEEIFGQPVQGIGLAVHLQSLLSRLETLKKGAQYLRPTTAEDLLPPDTTPPVPPFPHVFLSGKVTINGEPAPNGTPVFAQVDRYVSPWVEVRDGEYRNLTVGPPTDSYVGRTIRFYVDGFLAPVTATFRSDTFSTLELAVTIVSS